MNGIIEKTNKEKADQLVKLTHSYEDGLAYIHTDRVLYENLMEMAEWKDKQMIEKACKWLEDDMLNQNAFQGRLERLKIIDGIIERFKQDMSNDNDEDIDICDTCKDNPYCSKSNYTKSHCWRIE